MVDFESIQTKISEKKMYFKQLVLKSWLVSTFESIQAERND